MLMVIQPMKTLESGHAADWRANFALMDDVVCGRIIFCILLAYVAYVCYSPCLYLYYRVLCKLPYTVLGATHKVCHAVLGFFRPPSPPPPFLKKHHNSFNPIPRQTVYHKKFYIRICTQCEKSFRPHVRRGKKNWFRPPQRVYVFGINTAKGFNALTYSLF